MDDEPLLVRLNKRQLESKGYTVSVSTNSQDALALFQQNPDDFDLLLTDLTMPGMSGIELIKAIRAQSDTLSVIVLTGLVDEGTEEELLELGVSAIVCKPVMEDELTSAVATTFKED